MQQLCNSVCICVTDVYAVLLVVLMLSSSCLNHVSLMRVLALYSDLGSTSACCLPLHEQHLKDQQMQADLWLQNFDFVCACRHVYTRSLRANANPMGRARHEANTKGEAIGDLSDCAPGNCTVFGRLTDLPTSSNCLPCCTHGFCCMHSNHSKLSARIRPASRCLGFSIVVHGTVEYTHWLLHAYVQCNPIIALSLTYMRPVAVQTPSPSLVELDIRDCDKFDMSPPDCEEMRLSFLSFDYQQVDYHDIAWLHHFVVHEQDSESMFKPFLRMECGEHTSQCDVQRWTVEAPFCLLTHLTICNAGEWPRVFDFLTDLHQLQVLDLRFLLEFCQISSPACSLETIVALNSTAKLTELYIAHGSYTKYDLAQCTTLSVLGLIQQKGKKPASHLPPYLTQLYLFNIVS